MGDARVWWVTPGYGDARVGWVTPGRGGYHPTPHGATWYPPAALVNSPLTAWSDTELSDARLQPCRAPIRGAGEKPRLGRPKQGVRCGQQEVPPPQAGRGGLSRGRESAGFPETLTQREPHRDDARLTAPPASPRAQGLLLARGSSGPRIGPTVPRESLCSALGAAARPLCVLKRRFWCLGIWWPHPGLLLCSGDRMGCGGVPRAG